MPNFVHTVPLYGRNIRVKCKELDFLTYKNLTKTIYSNSAEDINTYVDQVLEDLVVNADTNEFDIIDKFIILGHIRDVAISGDFALNAHCEKTNNEYTINVDLVQVIEQINKIQIQKTYQAKAAGITVNFQLPKSFNAIDLSDAVSACLHSVVSKSGTEVVIPDYADRTKLLEKLPISVINDFEKYLKAESEKLSKTPLFKYKSPHADDAPMNIYRFSFLDTSCLELLKLLFQEDLLQMYEFEYDLYNICRLPYEVVRNSSFSELQVVYNIEARRRAEEQKESPQPAGSLPVGPPSTSNYEQ